VQKADLKTGMIIRYRNGEHAVVVRRMLYGDCLVGLEGEVSLYTPLNRYEDDLMHVVDIDHMECSKSYDIMAVSGQWYFGSIIDMLRRKKSFAENVEWVWERDETKEKEKAELLERRKAIEDELNTISSRLTELEGTVDKSV
jgi:hypothetical protein